MKKYFLKFIIYLFEKYAMDYWIDEQEKEQREEFKKEHNLKDDEVEEALIDISQEERRTSYQAGKHDGWEEAEEYFGG